MGANAARREARPTIAFMFSREPQRDQSEEDKRVYAVPTLSETARALLSPLFLIFLVGKMAFTTGLSGIATWGPSFFHRAYGLSNTDASSIFASGWVSVGLIGLLLGGWIGGVWRRRNPFVYPLIVTMGCAITAPALFAAFLGQNQAASHVFILLEIFFTCFCLGPVNALLIETVPVAQRSAASAVTVKLSTLDLFGGKFALLTGADYQPAKLETDSVAVFRNGSDFVADSFEELYGISQTGAVLVRPDGYVGARLPQVPKNFPEQFQSAIASILRARLQWNAVPY